MMYYSDFGFGWIFMVIFWIVIIWVIAALLRGSRYHRGCSYCRHHHHHHHGHAGRALDILEERYAKGEVTKEEYQEMKHNLSK